MLKLTNAEDRKERRLLRRRRQAPPTSRIVSARTRRSLAASARLAASGGPARSRHTVLLVDRAAAVRDELLELALILEHADHRDAAWVFAIRKLLTDGCESPLYNRDIHMSELRAALYYLRRDADVRAQPRPVTPAAPGSLR